MKERNIDVEWVQVGNETTDGMLWNDADGDDALKVTGRSYITLNESIVRLVLDVLEVSQVACVCQLVEVDDVILRVQGRPLCLEGASVCPD